MPNPGLQDSLLEAGFEQLGADRGDDCGAASATKGSFYRCAPSSSEKQQGGRCLDRAKI